jgi:heme/copper-type cytochrome/quinol oxidase subunit 2
MNYLFLGRAWLATHRDNMNHFAGVFLFCAGSTIYCTSLLRLAGEREKSQAQIHLVMEVGLFLSTVVLVLAFVTVWAIEETNGEHGSHTGENQESAYIVEHAAYIVFLLFYATFFVFHTPDPWEPPGLREAYVEEHSMDPECVSMRPLMHPSRAN